MPAYNALPTSELPQGYSIALVNNAATDSSVTTTQQVYIGPVPGASSNTINIINSTNQQATGQISQDDVAADYQNASGMIVAAGTSLPYNMANGWLRFTFSPAPTSGSLVVTR